MYAPGRVNVRGKLNLQQLQRELDLISKETQQLGRNLTRDISTSSGGLKLIDVINYFQSKNIDWDDIDYTFNSENQVTQRVYKRDPGASTVVTEVLAYDAYRNISTRTFTGELAETWTYTYTLTNGERIVTDITKT